MVPSPSDVADSIEAVVRRLGEVPPDDPVFTREVDVFDLGYVDSIGYVELVEFIETSYGVTLDDEDVFDDRFNTISGMAAIVHSRIGSQPPGVHAQ